MHSTTYCTHHVYTSILRCLSECSALLPFHFFDFDFLSLISAQVEGQVVPAGVDDVQGNVTGYDSDTSGSALQQ